jgi:hypothetical protein
MAQDKQGEFGSGQADVHTAHIGKETNTAIFLIKLHSIQIYPLFLFLTTSCSYAREYDDLLFLPLKTVDCVKVNRIYNVASKPFLKCSF